MLTPLECMLRDETGATAVEYGLLLAFIALAAVLAVVTFGRSVSVLFRRPVSEG